jgi:hypothetical protein
MISRVTRGLLALSCLLALTWSLTSVMGPIDGTRADGETVLALTDADGFVVGLGTFSSSGRGSSPRELLDREGSQSDDDVIIYDPVPGGTGATSTPFPTGSPVTSTTAGTTRTTARPTTTAAPVSSTTVPVTTTTAGGGGAPAGSVQLKPGDSVASIVAGAATGTTFWFTAGTYTGLQIVPKANQVFLGASGAVLAGNGKVFAFRSSAAGVTISGLTLQGYEPASKNGVIDGADGAANWTVSNNVIANNGEVGIRLGTGFKVIGNYIHHNGRYGIMGSGTNVLIEDNEIAYNANEYGATGDSSGTKFVHTVNLVLRGNYAHNNWGNGLWVDINNLNALIENNTSVANSRNGIFLEISCGGIIRNNYLEGNGTDGQYADWMGDATGIQVSMTPDVQVYGNTLVNNAKGIGAIHWDHQNVGAVTKCEPELRNLRVYSNSITQNGSAAAGIDAGIDQTLVYGAWDNQFYSNTYSLTGGAQFRYEGNWISHQQWLDAGMG